MSELIVAPSVLSANFARIQSAIESIIQAGADWIHLDVMDGCFVPNLTFGPKMISDIRPLTRLPLDVHLMTLEPEKLMQNYIDAGVDYLTFHMEATTHAHRLIQAIREAGAKPGVSIVPSTPIYVLEEVLDMVDQVLIMTVNPGFGGQKLIPSCLEKVVQLYRIRKARELGFLIAVDGGINSDTINAVAKACPDIVVVGSAFFSAPNPKNVVSEFKNTFYNAKRPGSGKQKGVIV